MLRIAKDRFLLHTRRKFIQEILIATELTWKLPLASCTEIKGKYFIDKRALAAAASGACGQVIYSTEKSNYDELWVSI